MIKRKTTIGVGRPTMHPGFRKMGVFRTYGQPKLYTSYLPYTILVILQELRSGVFSWELDYVAVGAAAACPGSRSPCYGIRLPTASGLKQDTSNWLQGSPLSALWISSLP